MFLFHGLGTKICLEVLFDLCVSWKDEVKNAGNCSWLQPALLADPDHRVAGVSVICRPGVWPCLLGVCAEERGILWLAVCRH